MCGKICSTKQLCFGQKSCKCSNMSARCHCLREMLKCVCYETTDIFCRKLKRKKSLFFCRLWFSCYGSWLRSGFSWKNPWIFSNTFSVWKVCAWERTGFGKEDEMWLNWVLCFITSTLIICSSPWCYDTLSFALWSCFVARVSFQGALLAEWFPPDSSACMRSILYPWPLVMHNLLVNSANMGKK